MVCYHVRVDTVPVIRRAGRPGHLQIPKVRKV